MEPIRDESPTSVEPSYEEDSSLPQSPGRVQPSFNAALARAELADLVDASSRAHSHAQVTREHVSTGRTFGRLDDGSLAKAWQKTRDVVWKYRQGFHDLFALRELESHLDKPHEERVVAQPVSFKRVRGRNYALAYRDSREQEQFGSSDDEVEPPVDIGEQIPLTSSRLSPRDPGVQTGTAAYTGPSPHSPVGNHFMRKVGTTDSKLNAAHALAWDLFKRPPSVPRDGRESSRERHPSANLSHVETVESVAAAETEEQQFIDELRSQYLRDAINFDDLEAAQNIPTVFIRPEDVFLKLSRSFMNNGCPVHRLEPLMNDLAHRLDFVCEIIVQTGTIFCLFGEGRNTEMHMIRAPEGLNSEKLQLLEQVGQLLLNGSIKRYGKDKDASLADRTGMAARALNHVLRMPDRPGPIGFVLGLAGTPVAAMTLFFPADNLDLGIGFLVGGFLACISMVVGRVAPQTHDYYMAFITGMVVTLLTYLIGGICSSGLSISVLIHLLPGMGITISILELITNNKTSGTSRFVFSLILAFGIGLSLDFGTRTMGFLLGLSRDDIVALDVCDGNPYQPYFEWPAVVLAVYSIATLFGSHPRQIPAAIPVIFASYGVYRSLRPMASNIEATIAGAYAVGVVSDLIAEFTPVPDLVLSLPAIMLLVPGSLSLLTAQHILNSNVEASVTFGFNIVATSVAIAFGLKVSALFSLRKLDRLIVYATRGVYPGIFAPRADLHFSMV
eukprot:Clim_evm9s250 gene=Clim_evmTU9s250